MGITGTNRTVTCPHRVGSTVAYVNNDGVSPPVLLVHLVGGAACLSLTNQIVRVNCLACFEEIRKAAGRRSDLGTAFQQHPPRD